MGHTAYVIREPETFIREEETQHYFDKFLRKHLFTQPLLSPTYEVVVAVDYGICCGLDDIRKTFATESERDKWIDDLKNNRIPKVVYDQRHFRGAG